MAVGRTGTTQDGRGKVVCIDAGRARLEAKAKSCERCGTTEDVREFGKGVKLYCCGPCVHAWGLELKAQERRYHGMY